MIGELKLSAERARNVAIRNGLQPTTFVPAAPKARAPLVERDATGVVTAVLPTGLARIERLARQGAPLQKVAASLGILLKHMKNLMGRTQGENAVRFAWEKGRGDFEHEVIKKLMKHGNKSFVPLIFVGKWVCGLQETGAQAAQIQNSVTLMLPRPRTRAEFFSMMQIPDPREEAAAA